MKRQFVAVAILLFSSSCEIGEESDDVDSMAVMGGAPVAGGHGAVSLTGPRGNCTGVIIHPNIMITADHCITGELLTGSDPNEGSYVAKGNRQYAFGSGFFKIRGTENGSTWICHTSGVNGSCESQRFSYVRWKRRQKMDAPNDFAILFREKPFDNNPRIMELSTDVFENLQYNFYGRGRTASNTDIDRMRRMVGKVNWRGRYHFVTEGRSHRLCPGDSGGPALAGGRVIGLASNKSNRWWTASSGNNCANRGGKQRFHRIRTEHIEFFQEIIKNLLPSGAPQCVSRPYGRWWCGG